MILKKGDGSWEMGWQVVVWPNKNKQKTKKKQTEKFPLAGVLAPGSSDACPSAQPHRHQRKYSWVKQKMKNCLINFLAISGDSKHFTFFSQKKP